MKQPKVVETSHGHGSGRERRTSPRVNVRDRVKAEAVDLAQDVIIHDMSLGGFLIESPEAFPVGALHQFRVAANDGSWTTMLTATCVNSRPWQGETDSPSYLTGFAFVEPQGLDAQQRLQALVG